jgi:signal recognition particle subunit SRP54
VFERLSERLQQVMKKLRGQARVSEEVLAETLREIRLALLEADVAVPVVKRLLDAVKTKAQGADVQGSLTPGQQVIKIVRDELVALLGGEGARDLVLGSSYPAVVMLVGLQGSGKTTTTSKIGRLLKSRRRFPFLIPADIARPAAIAQLVKLANEAGLGVFDHDGKDTPLGVVKKGMIAPARRASTSSSSTPPGACTSTRP